MACNRVWHVALFFVLSIIQARAAEVTQSGCDIVILGNFELGDEVRFRNAAVDVVRSGCSTPKVHIYSDGGSFEAALRIASDVKTLHAVTVSPVIRGQLTSDKALPRDAPRSCPLIPGEKEREQSELESFSNHLRERAKALEQGRPAPTDTSQPWTFDPRTGRGDRRCNCVSACFFVWIAGAERQGDVVLVHRPYFDPPSYAKLELERARSAFGSLSKEARKFLVDLDVPNGIIDKVLSTSSDKAKYLTKAELDHLRTAAYLEELKTAKCGLPPEPEPVLPSDAAEKYNGPYKSLSPSERRFLLKMIKRKKCWVEAQPELRVQLNSNFLRLHQR